MRFNNPTIQLICFIASISTKKFHFEYEFDYATHLHSLETKIPLLKSSTKVYIEYSEAFLCKISRTLGRK